MPQRLRKLIGTIALNVFVGFYALLVMAIASAKVADASGAVQLIFFLVAGLVWVLPAAALILWMQRPDRPV
jgi:hypothetical protein